MPKIWRTLPVIASLDGSLLFAAYALDHWHDRETDDNESFIDAAAQVYVDKWLECRDANDRLMFSVVLPDGRWRRVMLAKDYETGQERLC